MLFTATDVSMGIVIMGNEHKENVIMAKYSYGNVIIVYVIM